MGFGIAKQGTKQCKKSMRALGARRDIRANARALGEGALVVPMHLGSVGDVGGIQKGKAVAADCHRSADEGDAREGRKREGRVTDNLKRVLQSGQRIEEHGFEDIVLVDEEITPHSGQRIN